MTQWTDWETVTLIPRLGVNRVDVIAVSLDLERPSLERLEKLLSTDELSRADRFVYPEHRRRFVACRGVLRSFLGSHLDLDPETTVKLLYRLRISSGVPDTQIGRRGSIH